ncbi:unnamed protein product [Gulo gulo]|uniref:Uncharacterized protein n=1 Tax=Gulo gulo TaxID=48420 RepID=A0A9X9LPR8_GULGU|nr:unnamed protein product [Gulo gulo]
MAEFGTSGSRVAQPGPTGPPPGGSRWWLGFTIIAEEAFSCGEEPRDGLLGCRRARTLITLCSLAAVRRQGAEDGRIIPGFMCQVRDALL